MRVSKCDWTRIAKSGFACFIVMITITAVAQTFPVTAHETNVRPEANSASDSGRTQPFTASHERSIRHISSIDNQSIGCTSLDAQNAGRSYAQQLDTTFTLIIDPVIADYVNHIVQTLVHTSNTQVQLDVRIINTAEVNAFSLPGGFIFIDAGLILAAANEAEFAGALSHEIAHVAACHAKQEMMRMELATVGSMPLIFRLVVRPITRNTIYPQPTRSFESEADGLGIDYLYKAGYDPQALVSMLKSVKALTKQKAPNRLSDVESASLTDRIARARRMLRTAQLTSREYKVDTSEFQRIRDKVSQLLNRDN